MVWNDVIANFSELVASEYNMREVLDDINLYNLQENKFIDTTPDSIGTGNNWSNTFQYLGQRHIAGNAPMLWCNLFALIMLFNHKPMNSQLLIVPCYFKISAGDTNYDATKWLLRFTFVPPQAMGILEDGRHYS